MRKIIVLSFVSLDGVMQAPGGPEEGTSGGFTHGGWTFPYFDEFAGRVMDQQMGEPFDLLLGRKTFDIFAGYWPEHPEEGAAINAATKYVASRTVTSHPWDKSVFLSDLPAQLHALKQTDGPDLQVHGSGELIQTLLQHDLVDALWLKIFPVLLGGGKRLFRDGIAPATLTLTETQTSPTGVIFANYTRADGEIKTGNF